SSYELLEEALTLPSVVALPLDSKGNSSRRGFPAVAADTASIGPLAVGDIDGDGDLDLFVGGRVTPGEYPRSAGSRILLNQGGGTFRLDVANTALLKGVGMVSSAILTDVNGDGSPDLVLAIEWDALKLFLNHQGRFEPAGPEWGLGQLRNRWIGVA